MTGPTHVISGLAAAAAIGRLAAPPPTPLELLALLAGTLAPDIDGRGTITRPGTILRPFLGRTLGGFLDGLFAVVARTINICFGHRGFIHAPLVAVAFFALAAAFEHTWLWWFAVGYALHLVGDALTVEGIPVWSPFSCQRLSLSRLRTGSRSEGALAAAFLLLAIALGWTLLPDAVQATQRGLLEAVLQTAASH